MKRKSPRYVAVTHTNHDKVVYVGSNKQQVEIETYRLLAYDDEYKDFDSTFVHLHILIMTQFKRMFKLKTETDVTNYLKLNNLLT